ncbi:MAG: carboxypeptidase-like regulatory domain-containing protein, partial [Candidatus Aenigmatarchaeota archaeon]
MKKKDSYKILFLFLAFFLAFNFGYSACDLSYQTYRYKSATFYVTNAQKIIVEVFNSMNDLYPRCFTAWIIVNGKYINLDGLPYSPDNWSEAWKNEAPNCFNSGYRVAYNYGYAEYDLSKFLNQSYTGIVEVRVSSDCYEVLSSDPCFCWNVNVKVIQAQIIQPTQYGTLKVKVVDCFSKLPIENAKVYVSKDDPIINYTDYNGYATFNLEVGRYRIDVSKDGYYSSSATADIKCSQTTEIEICLNKIQVCFPGEIKNRRCVCPTQVAYEICKADGSGWETKIENCLSGYICDNGYCILNKDGWYDTGNEKCEISSECGYGTKMKEQEYRKYTCFGVTCTYTVIERRWISIGTCYKDCPSGYICENGKCVQEVIFDCNSLDGWYTTNEEKCEVAFECGEGIRKVKKEYRDYYPIVEKPKSTSDCSFIVTSIDWFSIGSCFKDCPSGYYCLNGFCKPISLAFAPQKCNVMIYVKEKENNFPIENAKVCVQNSCYYTDYSGLASFTVYQGSYTVSISKDGYETQIFNIECQACGNDIVRTVFLNPIKICFNCNLLDGWYYTTESYCEMKGVECGNGIRLRKEEFRDYSNVCVSSKEDCKDYKVLGYRWVEDGLCFRDCGSGYKCEEGFCKKTFVEKEEKFVAIDMLENGTVIPKQTELMSVTIKTYPRKEDILTFSLLLIFILAFLLLKRFKRKK